MKIMQLFQIKNYFKVISNNSINIEHRLKKSKILVNGINNILQIGKSNLKKININISGNNNKLIIEENCHIRNLTIIIIGENLSVKLGKNTKIGEAQIVCAGNNSSIQIGDNNLFAHGIEIRNNDGHSIYNQTGVLLNPSKNIFIGNNVWLSQNVKILKGVTINENSVVAMSSIVSKGEYAKNSILAGIPAKIIKENIYWSMEIPN